jgi:hypothetical protein
MKTRFAITLAVTGIVFFAAAAPTALAATFSDDFSSGLRPAYWTVTQTTPGLFSVDDTHGDVRLAKVGNNPGGIQSVEIHLNMAAVGGPISGDFSMQIDFSNAVVGPNNDQIPLNTYLSGSPFDPTYDSLTCGSLNVHVWNGSVQGCTPVTGNSGTFTVARTGSTLTGSYNGSPIFSETNSSVVTGISFALQLQPGSNDNTSVTFDNFSLTAASVPSACTTPPPQMVSWWPGDGNANDIQDGNNGTLENGATFAPGLVGQAFVFNGTNQDVLIGSPANLRITGAITLDAWVNPSQLPANGELGSIVTKWFGSPGHPNIPADSYGLWLINSGGNLRLIGAIGDSVSEDMGLIGATNIPLNQWTHAAMTYDSSTGANTIYVNGTADGGRTRPNGITSNTTNVYIGRQDSSFAPRFFAGEIDEVEIFNRVLSQSEIQAIVAAGAFGKCKGQPTPTPTASSTPTATPTPTPTSTPCAGRCTPTPRPRPTPAPRPTS